MLFLYLGLYVCTVYTAVVYVAVYILVQSEEDILLFGKQNL